MATNIENSAADAPTDNGSILETCWREMQLPGEVRQILEHCPGWRVPRSRDELFLLAMGGSATSETFDVNYTLPNGEVFHEATVTRCKNGLSVNYPDPALRRRDPNCMVIADQLPTDKPRYTDRFQTTFDEVREQTFEWFKGQELILLPLYTGGKELGYATLLVCPKNAAFFAGAFADLQEFIPADEVPMDYEPLAVIYLAPPFRHTHYEGKQVVVHNRKPRVHEVFSYNLYPGPSAKKGSYGVLLHRGEKEGWLTAHGATVQVITPYDNIVTLMHEGASGGGKSEILEPIHRQPDGQVLLGRNLKTKEKRMLSLAHACDLRPVTDDMALCHPTLQGSDGKLAVTDAETGWFLRFNHISRYGTDPYWESLCCHPAEPLLMLNMDAKPGSTALIWEHIEDAPGKRCPNPRVIMPRRLVPEIVKQPVHVDVRSFGIRTPPCTRDAPSYGILGLLHVLPPALAWLWRLVAPRGHANPSIVDSEALSSEGVGSYWPFATGRRVVQANLLLRQIQATPRTRYVLIPNQHVGVWHVGFMPQWISREYLARRGSARFREDQIRPARCNLLGYAMNSMQVEGTTIPHWFLETESQPELGVEGYDKGADILRGFFHHELKLYLEEDLDRLGRKIIDCCLQNGALADYDDLLPHETILYS